MAAYSALYYPYIAVQDESLLKVALLLWDQLHYLVPSSDHPLPAGGEVRRAMDVIGNPLVPSESAKQIAAQRLEELASCEVPREFFLEPATKDPRVQIFNAKFDEMTWCMLRERGLSAMPGGWGYRAQEVTSPLGLLMMSVLTHACAEGAYTPVTDQVSGYEGLARVMGQGSGPSHAPGEVTALHELRLPFLDLDEITLPDLIKLREREASSGAEGADIRAMRHGFLASMQKLGAALVSANGEARKESLRVYEQEMKDGAAKMLAGLKRKRTEVFNSKDVRMAVLGLVAGAGVVATGGVAALPVAGAAMAQGAGALLAVERSWSLTGVLTKYKADRQDVINGSPVGYLYTANKFAKKPWFTLT